jgi:hypothetical protein
MSYSGRGGHYWDKSSCVIATRGAYYLEDDSACEFGEPACVDGTGVTAMPFNKKPVYSYEAGAGTVQALGVFIDFRANISAWDEEDFALKGTRDRNREPTIVLRGPVEIHNMSGAIDDGDTVIPADGGCIKMASSGQYSLGKAMENIPAGKRGLVFVMPDYEKPII